MKPKLSGLLISDFTVDVLKSFLINSLGVDSADVQVAPFGQTISLLKNPMDPVWQKPVDFCVIWSQIWSVIPSYQKILRFEDVPQEVLLSECDLFINSIKEASQRSRYVFVMNWVLPEFFRGYGPIDLSKANGWRFSLLRLNQYLAQELSKVSNVYLLSSDRWVQAIGEKACDPRLWYMSKMPYDSAVFKLAAEDIKAALNALLGQSRKLVIVDLDDTLWGGVVGDDGWKNLRLGGHDPQGEAYADFQRVLKSYQQRGVVLGIVSKNQEEVAWQVFDLHQEMILKKSDFVGWRINWKDKVENITDLLKELNLSQESAVFIDDNPAERDRVQAALPGVLVPAWPQNSLLYTKAFLSLTCFDTSFISDDDRKRSQMYIQEKDRRAVREQVQSAEEWLVSLNTIITVEPLASTNISRATQLLNKTNQMNLTTRRLSEQEFLTWSENAQHRVWVFRVEDKLGDSGLTGLASFAFSGSEGQIVDFVLSCRVFGRQVENVMVGILIEEAQKLGIHQLKAVYVPTEKNNPCLEFFNERSGLNKHAGHQFAWNEGVVLTKPKGITINQVERLIQ